MSIEGKKIFLIGKDGIQKDKTQNIDSILSILSIMNV